MKEVTALLLAVPLGLLILLLLLGIPFFAFTEYVVTVNVAEKFLSLIPITVVLFAIGVFIAQEDNETNL